MRAWLRPTRRAWGQALRGRRGRSAAVADTRPSLYPPGNDADNMFLLSDAEGAARFNCVPLGKAASAAGCRSVLGYENRMSPKRRLLAVVSRCGRSETLCNKLSCVLDHRLLAVSSVIRELFRAEHELATETRLR
jgi:hypothetical protein